MFTPGLGNTSLNKSSKLAKRKRVFGVAQKFGIDARAGDDTCRVFSQFSQYVRDFDQHTNALLPFHTEDSRLNGV